MFVPTVFGDWIDTVVNRSIKKFRINDAKRRTLMPCKASVTVELHG